MLQQVFIQVFQILFLIWKMLKSLMMSTQVFSQIYTKCAMIKAGKFMLVKISDSVKSALADAFLDTLIPTYTSVDLAVSKISS